jgi:hypothetical protein
MFLVVPFYFLDFASKLLLLDFCSVFLLALDAPVCKGSLLNRTGLDAYGHMTLHFNEIRNRVG